MTPAHATPLLERSPMAFLRCAALAALLAAAFCRPAAFGQRRPATPRAAADPRAAAAGPDLGERRRRPAPGRHGRAAAACYPPSAYNPYGYPSYQGPVGGALSGAANVVGAQGQY